MTNILEAFMLICFGLSWPMSLYKNIKAKTAKSMSLQFTLLIIIGYIAGITAKIINNSICDNVTTKYSHKPHKYLIKFAFSSTFY